MIKDPNNHLARLRHLMLLCAAMVVLWCSRGQCLLDDCCQRNALLSELPEEFLNAVSLRVKSFACAAGDGEDCRHVSSHSGPEVSPHFRNSPTSFSHILSEHGRWINHQSAVVVRSDDASLHAASQTIYVLLTGEVQLHISRSSTPSEVAAAHGAVQEEEEEIMIQLVHAGQRCVGNESDQSSAVQQASFVDHFANSPLE